LVWADTALLEGTGIRGLSSLRRTRLETGEILQIRDTPISAFGEGITQVEDRIYQLTWQIRVAFVYDAATFDSIGEFHYTTEGWGLTHDGQRFIMSDGTSTIYFRDFDTFDVTGTIQVTDENGPVSQLNELEYIHGKIFANVWTTDYIVIISPNTGDVLGRIDCSGLLENPRGVLNGIAFDQENGRLFVTGKNWPSLFHIRFLEKG
jgi:glutamine cyclotransferase